MDVFPLARLMTVKTQSVPSKNLEVKRLKWGEESKMGKSC